MWAMPGWQPNLVFAEDRRRWNTCGSATLSLITGADPRRIEKKLPGSAKHWSARSLRGFLHSKGWETKLLPPRFVIGSLPDGDWDSPTLTKEHLIVFSAWTTTKEASWFLHADGKLWHNMYEETQKNPLFFIRRPAIDVILIRK